MPARDEVAKTLLRLGKTEFDTLRADALPGAPAQDWAATLAVTHTQDATVWTLRPLHLALPARPNGVRADIRALAIDGEDAFRAALDDWGDAPAPAETGKGLRFAS